MSSTPFDTLWRVMQPRNIKPIISDNNLTCIICDNVMLNAYISNCGCHFCKPCLDDYLHGNIKICPGSKKECSCQALLIDENVFPDNSANIKILRLIVKCPNDDCGSELEYGKMEEHLRVCEKTVSDCPYRKFGCDRKEKKDNLLNHLKNEDVNHSKLVLDVIDFLRNELNSVRNELNESKLETMRIKKDFEYRLNEESQNTQDALEKLRGHITAYNWKAGNRVNEDSSFGSNCGSVHGLCDVGAAAFANYEVGGTHWLLRDFTEIMEKSANNPKFFQYSPLFLSHEGGYTFNLILYANGFAIGKGTHLYVGFCIAKGACDDQLPWPFRGLVEISLVDQISNAAKVTKQFQYDSLPKSKKSLFDKPVKRFNYNCGDSRFIELSTLRRSGTLLLNDSLLVRCVISNGLI